MIQLSIPNLNGNELKYLSQCIEQNMVSSVGSFVTDFENEFAKFHHQEKAVAVMNGTSAIHASLIIAGVKPGHEVLAPNLTFVAPLNAIKYIQANPVLIDSEWETMGMNPQKLEDFLVNQTYQQDGVCFNKNTKNVISAVLPVHIMGNLCQIEKICELAKKYNLKVIEDASEALGAQINGKLAGTFGDFGCFSLNGNKIITSGGGGVILGKNANDLNLVRHICTTAKINSLEFDHDQVGFNYRMVNLLAAVALAQLEQLAEFLKIKRKNFLYYQNQLTGNSLVKLHHLENLEASNCWFYSVILNDNLVKYRMKIIEQLNKEGVSVRPIWKLMEDLPMFKDSKKTNCDISRDIYNRIVNIPCSTSITNKEIDTVCAVLKKVVVQFERL